MIETTQVLCSYTLALGGGVSILACDPSAVQLVRIFAEAMHLPPGADGAQSVYVSFNGLADLEANDHARVFTYQIPEDEEKFPLILLLFRLSYFVASCLIENGGFLLHSALAVRNGMAVILAGHGGVGKSTASRRLHSPWVSWSDDATLVMPGSQGVYLARPWPTWSRFNLRADNFEAWDVTQGVPLKGAFFLSQSETDHVSLLGRGETAGKLAYSTEEIYLHGGQAHNVQLMREERSKRFELACSLAEGIPGFDLQVSLKGAFWNEIELALGWQELS